MSTLTTVARRVASGTAVAVAAAAALAVVPTANADTAFGLPNGRAKGDGFSIYKYGEKVRISSSMAANAAARNAWVSGKVKVAAPGIEERESGPNNGPLGEDSMPGSNGTSNAGAAATLSVAYVVGCQVDIGDLDAGMDFGLLNGGFGFDAISGSVSLPLAPGRVLYVLVAKKQMEKPGTYHFGYNSSTMAISGCGGYAQARSYVTVETSGNNHQKVTLWGKPFSLG